MVFGISLEKDRSHENSLMFEKRKRRYGKDSNKWKVCNVKKVYNFFKIMWF